ncbi:MAG: thiol:disulfide interchange protein DsbA/DsbL [Gammaproteobacteria bacterium]|nr:thiol:disulfide interchange protein DsbA/DsbL [Gammaproteobacteria bacterium]MDH5594847.1 thiol:disulfide interchange protein DsbA/DsbL [Gammaproteobacteria bacterium]MDH5613484.1 thiol:disulfide interchange protein DsbA/DsbL [Gammaproteobacteria bacterium]
MISRITRTSLVWLVLFLSSFNVFAEYAEGFEYQRVTPAQPVTTKNKIEVLELFWYGCPHCYRLEPYLHTWLKTKPANVEYVRLPAVLRDDWGIHAHAFYTAEALGITEKIHTALFEAIHKDRKRIASKEDIRTLFISHGIAAEEFDNAWSSFSVKIKLNKAKLRGNRYGANGVPTLIVNGKYRVTGTTAGGTENIMKVVDFLVKKESKANMASK